MAHQYALRTKTGNQYVKRLGFYGAVQPVIQHDGLGTLSEALLFTEKQLYAKRGAFTTNELFQQHLPNYDLVKVSLEEQWYDEDAQESSESIQSPSIEVGDLVFSRDVNTHVKEYWTVQDIHHQHYGETAYFDEEGYFHRYEDLTLVCKARHLY
ncbi:hypothetical protein [Rossellomorea marisflavi]|uniref:hypothetical protein n=1 Tax=Rossellomorea marisflavi TaxID=189381 RepID=UPI003F9FB9DB